MIISKAIEILQDLDDWDLTHYNLDSKSAILLGIEALKRCQYIAEHTDRWAGVLLAGETPENEK